MKSHRTTPCGQSLIETALALPLLLILLGGGYWFYRDLSLSSAAESAAHAQMLRAGRRLTGIEPRLSGTIHPMDNVAHIEAHNDPLIREVPPVQRPVWQNDSVRGRLPWKRSGGRVPRPAVPRPPQRGGGRRGLLGKGDTFRLYGPEDRPGDPVDRRAPLSRKFLTGLAVAATLFIFLCLAASGNALRKEISSTRRVVIDGRSFASDESSPDEGSLVERELGRLGSPPPRRVQPSRGFRSRRTRRFPAG